MKKYIFFTRIVCRNCGEVTLEFTSCIATTSVEAWESLPERNRFSIFTITKL